jgi:hypothetical protein
MLNDMVAVRLHRFPACIRAISIFTVISELCSQSPARKPLSAGNRVGYAALPERHNASAIAFVIPREAVFLQAANGVYKLGGKKRLGKEGIARKSITLSCSADHQQYGSVWKIRLHDTGESVTIKFWH